MQEDRLICTLSYYVDSNEIINFTHCILKMIFIACVTICIHSILIYKVIPLSTKMIIITKIPLMYAHKNFALSIKAFESKLWKKPLTVSFHTRDGSILISEANSATLKTLYFVFVGKIFFVYCESLNYTCQFNVKIYSMIEVQLLCVLKI